MVSYFASRIYKFSGRMAFAEVIKRIVLQSLICRTTEPKCKQINVPVALRYPLRMNPYQERREMVEMVAECKEEVDCRSSDVQATCPGG